MAPSATRRAAELKFSPCGEQFGCIEEGGSLCLWRFQSGTDVPLPFSRLQCHGKRGADLCFVGTSVVVATVGLSVGLTAPSLCLWDVLLPPSQALITSCAAHSEGGCCVLHSPSDMSLISGRSMVTSASSQRPMRPPTAPEAHPLAQGCPPSGPERGAFATWMPGEAAAETLVPARSRRFHLRVNHGLPPGGGQKGEMVIFDLRQQRQRAQWSAHSLATRSLALDATTEFCFSASSDGDIKLWDLAPATPCPCCPCSRVANLINPAVATLVINPAVATLCSRGRNPVCPGGTSSSLVPPTRRARAASPTSVRPPSRRRGCWALGPGRTSRTRCCTPSPGCKSAAPTGWRSSSRTAPTGLSAPAPTARAACGTFVEVTHTGSCDSAQRSVSDIRLSNQSTGTSPYRKVLYFIRL